MIENSLERKDKAQIINKIDILTIGSQFLNSENNGVKSLSSSSFFNKLEDSSSSGLGVYFLEASLDSDRSGPFSGSGLTDLVFFLVFRFYTPSDILSFISK